MGFDEELIGLDAADPLSASIGKRRSRP